MYLNPPYTPLYPEWEYTFGEVNLFRQEKLNCGIQPFNVWGNQAEFKRIDKWVEGLPALEEDSHGGRLDDANLKWREYVFEILVAAHMRLIQPMVGPN